jgi:parallel beta-helix repeat protein
LAIVGKAFSGIMLALLPLGMLTLAFDIQPVKAYWYNAIYITADGSVDPLGAPISTVDNVTYILTADIYDYSIVVERDNIVLDGAGCTVYGTVIYASTPAGIYLSGSSNVSIKNVQIEAFYYGVELYGSSNNSIYENSITNCTDGIFLLYSSNNNSIHGNSILANNQYGIRLYDLSNDNKIYGNNIKANGEDGISTYYSSNNEIYGNNITVNKNGIGLGEGVSSNYTIFRNNITANNGCGIAFGSSNNGNIYENNITHNHDSGISLWSSSNITISGNNITANDWDGISLSDHSSNIDIYGNTVVANGMYGIRLDDYVIDNRIYGNKVIANGWAWGGSGIRLEESSNNNTISGNNIANNKCGIKLDSSSNNSIYHNNFVDNSEQVDSYNSINVWDNDYPSGGNYWDDYCELDTDGDGLGNTPYLIYDYTNNQDRYPLVVPRGPIPIVRNGMVCLVELKSNSTICRFRFEASQKMISFNVTGIPYTVGFCNLTLPNSLVQDLWQNNFTVLVDGEEPVMMDNWTDGTHTYIYFTYQHSEHKVEIIPEFPSFVILPLFMIVALLSVIVYRRKHSMLSEPSKISM